MKEMQPKEKKTVPAFGGHPETVHNPTMPNHISLCLILNLKYLIYDFNSEQYTIFET
jgi:hypothetical protein